MSLCINPVDKASYPRINTLPLRAFLRINTLPFTHKHSTLYIYQYVLPIWFTCMRLAFLWTRLTPCRTSMASLIINDIENLTKPDTKTTKARR